VTEEGAHVVLRTWGGPVEHLGSDALDHSDRRLDGPSISVRGSIDPLTIADYLWVLTWDLRGREPHTQRVLSHPSVNLTFTTGGRARVVGVVRGVFSETIEGRGRVVGVRFRPGGFRLFLDGPVSGITDRFTPVEEIFGPEARAVADAITAEPGVDEAVARP
jgi:hypothetical protein